MLHLSLDQYSINAKDYGYKINFTIQDASRAAFDLTGYTAKLKVWPYLSPGGYVVDAAATINSPNTLGTGYYTVQLNDFTAADKIYLVQVEISKTGVYQSTEAVKLTVLESPQNAF